MSGERSLHFRTDCCNRDWEGEPYHMMRNVSKMDHRQRAMVQGYECRNCGAFHEQGDGGWKVLYDAEAEPVARAISDSEARRRRMREHFTTITERTFEGTPFPEPITYPNEATRLAMRELERIEREINPPLVVHDHEALQRIVRSAMPAGSIQYIPPERRWTTVDYGQQEWRSHLLADPTAYQSVEDRRDSEPSRPRNPRDFINSDEVVRRNRERQRQMERRRELSEGLTLREYQNGTLRQMQSVSRTHRANSAPPQYVYFDEAETLRGMDINLINKLFGKLSTKEEKKKERVDPWLQ